MISQSVSHSHCASLFLSHKTNADADDDVGLVTRNFVRDCNSQKRPTERKCNGIKTRLLLAPLPQYCRYVASFHMDKFPDLPTTIPIRYFANGFYTIINLF
jgi:hypothetical protein